MCELWGWRSIQADIRKRNLAGDQARWVVNVETFRRKLGLKGSGPNYMAQRTGILGDVTDGKTQIVPGIILKGVIHNCNQ